MPITEADIDKIAQLAHLEITPEERRALTPQIASKFARIALGHVTREYPNKLDHVLNGPEDARALSGMTFPAYRHLLSLERAPRQLDMGPQNPITPVAVGAFEGSEALGLALAEEKGGEQRTAECVGQPPHRVFRGDPQRPVRRAVRPPHPQVNIRDEERLPQRVHDVVGGQQEWRENGAEDGENGDALG